MPSSSPNTLRKKIAETYSNCDNYKDEGFVVYKSNALGFSFRGRIEFATMKRGSEFRFEWNEKSQPSKRQICAVGRPRSVYCIEGPNKKRVFDSLWFAVAAYSGDTHESLGIICSLLFPRTKFPGFDQFTCSAVNLNLEDLGTSQLVTFGKVSQGHREAWALQVNRTTYQLEEIRSEITVPQSELQSWARNQYAVWESFADVSLDEVSNAWSGLVKAADRQQGDMITSRRIVYQDVHLDPKME